jgi:circadian clock protein KaiB
MTAKSATKTSKKKKKAAAADEESWNLRLYVVGQSAKSVAAIANLKKFCADHLDDRYTIEIIDVAADPKIARRDEIVAIPTLVRKLPVPVRKIIGDLSNTDRVLVSFDLHPRS